MMTAMCASPIVRRTCSPAPLRSRRTVGSSSSIRWSAGPILSRSPLDCGSMATISDGAGNSSGGSVSGFSCDASVSPVSVTVSLATAPISPALSSPIGSCSLPWSSSSWPIRSSSPRVAFQTWACEWSVPDSTRRYVSRPTNGSAVVLNTRTRSGPSSSAGTSTVAPPLSVAVDRRLVGRGGEVADDRVEQRRAGRSPWSRCRRGPAPGSISLTPLRRQASSSGSEISSPSRYLVRTSSSASAAASSSWSRRRATSSASSSGIGISTSFEPSQPPGLAMDEVDVAAERLGRADRELERRDLVAEGRAQRVERGGRVGVLAVALVDEEAGRGPGRAAQRDRLLEAGLDAGRGVHHEERAVGRGEALDDLGDEVRVAGRVDERDPRPVALERPDREAQRLAPLLLLGLEVEVGRPVVDAAEPRDRAGLETAAARRASSCRSRRGRPGRRSEGGGGRRSSSSSGSSVLPAGGRCDPWDRRRAAARGVRP